MKKITCGLLLLGLVATGPATAFERVDTILADQRLHGFTSPIAGLERLQAADDVPAAKDPIEQRRRYDAALLDLSLQARRPAVSEAALSRLETMAADEGCTKCQVDELVGRAVLAAQRMEIKQAEGFLLQAQRLVGGDKQQQLEILASRARMYRATGALPRSIETAVKASEMALALGDNARYLQLLATLVPDNANLGDTDRAESVGKEVYALAKSHGYRSLMGLVSLDLGHVYSLKNDRPKQLAALSDALSIAQGDASMADIEMLSLNNLADYYLSTERYPQALDHARRAEVIARSLGRRDLHAIAITNVGLAMAGLGDTAGGIARLEQAVKLVETWQNKRLVVGITTELIRLYETSGRYREALASMHKVAALNVALTEQEREKAVLELQEKYSTERKTRQIDQLSTENRIKQAELSARTWQQRLWAALALILALAAFWLVRWLTRARRSNRRLKSDNRELAKQTVHDPLTGAFNRRHCQTLMAQQEAVLVGRTRDPAYTASIGLVLIDVDFFKRINDTHGHAAGDAVLVALCQRLQGLVRQQDAVVRWGGEEFVLVLPGTSAAGLTVLVERVLRAIGETPVMVGDKAIPVTASAGCVAFPFFPRQHWEDALHVADLALYQSKAGGRNRATCLVRLHPDAQIDRVRSDLAAAQAAGDVELRIVMGPVAGDPAPALAEDAAQQQRLLVAESKT